MNRKPPPASVSAPALPRSGLSRRARASRPFPRSGVPGEHREPPAHANIVDIETPFVLTLLAYMAPAPLGEFEVLVLLAVLHLGEAAYPPAVRAEIERRAHRAVARGAVYVTLDRLEAKRLLASDLEIDARPGRPRRYYRVSSKGIRAVKRALAAVERMRVGLEPVLNES